MSLKRMFIESTKGLEFKDFFSNITSKHGDNFEDHISKSIPSYSEMTKLTAKALSSILDNESKVLDVGSSEGYFGDYLIKLNPNVVVHSLDPNWKMKEVFDKKHATDSGLQNNVFIQSAFGDGFYDEEEQRYYDGYKPTNEYDVVRESMTFQFLSTDRNEQYGLCKKALKKDGIFITNSKNFLLAQEEYQKYEKLKDQYKLKSFSQEDIDIKAKTVLPNMSKYMVNLDDTLGALKKHFRIVKQYWVSGNFHGFVCGNDEQKINSFVSKLPSPNKYPNAVEGKIVL